MSNTMTQVNVRMERELKQRGDAALAEVGISPSDIVRALWGKVALRGAALDQVKRLLFSSDEAQGTLEGESPVCEGWALADEFYQSMGYDSAQVPCTNQPWEELYKEAMDAHFAKKGLYQ